MKHKKIVIFEPIGGNDKGADGHRKDTLPILNSIKDLGWSAEVIKLENDKADEIFNYVKDNFEAYTSRVNPG